MGLQRRLVLLGLIAILSVGALFVPLWGTLRSPYVRSLATNAAHRTKAVQAGASDARLRGAYRFERGQWIYVHLEGPPARIGFQHGYLLAPEIADAFQAVKLIDTHDTQRDWEFFRKAAREMLWPQIEAEYQHGNPKGQPGPIGIVTNGIFTCRSRSFRFYLFGEARGESRAEPTNL